MITLTQTRLQALLGRLYWCDAVEIEPGVYELRPRRGAFLIRWAVRPQPIEGNVT
jgi:hypothetical protein